MAYFSNSRQIQNRQVAATNTKQNSFDNTNRTNNNAGFDFNKLNKQ